MVDMDGPSGGHPPVAAAQGAGIRGADPWDNELVRPDDALTRVPGLSLPTPFAVYPSSGRV